MKRRLLFTALIIFTAGLAGAETWIVKGQSFEVKKVISVSSSRVTVQHSKGITQFKLSSLSEELQERFEFDASKAEQEDEAYEQKRLATAVSEERRIQMKKQQVLREAHMKELEKRRAAQVQTHPRSRIRAPLKSRFDVNKVIKEIGDKTENEVQAVIGRPDRVTDYDDGMTRRYRYDNAVLDKKDNRLYPFYVYFEKKQFGTLKATSWRRWGIGRRLPLPTKNRIR